MTTNATEILIEKVLARVVRIESRLVCLAGALGVDVVVTHNPLAPPTSPKERLEAARLNWIKEASVAGLRIQTRLPHGPWMPLTTPAFDSVELEYRVHPEDDPSYFEYT